MRSYVVDDAGSVAKLVIPAGETGEGTYLPTWNGHGDALALWRVADDGSGALSLANSFTYTSWGAPTTAAHNGHPDLGFRFLYGGEFDVQWDDSFGLDLLYMHARHYSPLLGRFLQPDPDRSEANLYAYTANNPVTELDPDGTCFIVCVVVGAVIDSAVYLATTDQSEWSLAGATTAVLSGAVESAINPFAKLGKATRLAGAIGKALTKVPKARAAADRARAAVSRTSRGNRLAPNETAIGPHSTFRRDPSGAITHYATWKPQVNPRNPNPWMLHKRVDVVGKPHFNKATGRFVPTPHVQGGRALGGVRPARQWEIPRAR